MKDYDDYDDSGCTHDNLYIIGLLCRRYADLDFQIVFHYCCSSVRAFLS
jgi:hypothetical protein